MLPALRSNLKNNGMLKASLKCRLLLKTKLRINSRKNIDAFWKLLIRCWIEFSNNFMPELYLFFNHSDIIDFILKWQTKGCISCLRSSSSFALLGLCYIRAVTSSLVDFTSQGVFFLIFLVSFLFQSGYLELFWNLMLSLSKPEAPLKGTVQPEIYIFFTIYFLSWF